MISNGNFRSSRNNSSNRNNTKKGNRKLYPGRYQSRPEAPGFTPSLGGKECWIPPFNADNHFCQDMQAITPVPHELCVALDCEMVGVGRQKSSVLARVSLVDYRGIAIFDTFVRVEEKVTDYRTAVSGVRPQDLESPNAMDYGTCRWVVQGLLAGKILVGHALENDLKVLNLNHPWDQVRDTSVHPPFMKSNPHTGAYQARRLCHLTQSFLGKKIQQYEHDSLEDARAAMDLYMLVKPDWDYTVEFWSRQSRSTLHSQPSYDQRHGRKHYTTQRRHKIIASLGVPQTGASLTTRLPGDCLYGTMPAVDRTRIISTNE